MQEQYVLLPQWHNHNSDTPNFVFTERTFYAYTLESGKLFFLIKNTRELQTL